MGRVGSTNNGLLLDDIRMSVWITLHGMICWVNAEREEDHPNIALRFEALDDYVDIEWMILE